jgi:bifunctional non-homologous end joining protein LigD
MVVARYGLGDYANGSMPYEFPSPPAGSDWIHEIKSDGYRMMLFREQDHVQLISRGGHDWA